MNMANVMVSVEFCVWFVLPIPKRKAQTYYCPIKCIISVVVFHSINILGKKKGLFPQYQVLIMVANNFFLFKLVCVYVSIM